MTETKTERRASAAPAASRKFDVESVRIDAAPALDAAAAEVWDAFVASQPGASLGHLAGVRKLEHALGGAADRSLTATDADGRLVAVVPLFEVTARRLRAFRQRTLGTGRLLPGGPLVDARLAAKDRERLTARLHEAIEALARSLGCDLVEIALPGVVGGRPAVESLPVGTLARHGYRETARAGLFLDLGPDPEKLLAGLDSNCRNKVRRCRKERVTTRLLSDRTEWLQCHAYSMASEAPNRFPLAFFEILWDDFVAKGLALASAVTDGDDVLSVVLLSRFAGSSYYWFTFARPDRPAGSNNLALYDGLVAVRAQGAVCAELGSLEFLHGKEAAISRFKQGFGGKPIVGWAGTKLLRRVRVTGFAFAQEVVDAVRARLPQPGAADDAVPAREGEPASAPKS